MDKSGAQGCNLSLCPKNILPTALSVGVVCMQSAEGEVGR